MDVEKGLIPVVCLGPGQRVEYNFGNKRPTELARLEKFGFGPSQGFVPLSKLVRRHGLALCDRGKCTVYLKIFLTCIIYCECLGVLRKTYADYPLWYSIDQPQWRILTDLHPRLEVDKKNECLK